MNSAYRRLIFACYTANLSVSIVGNLSPLLFLTFRSLYGLSYSLLGLLVLINFVTQLAVDLLFSFYSHKMPIARVVKGMPVLTVLGLLIYALWPFFFPQQVYVGLVLGTVVFSASSGLAEVLISPVIAAVPAEDPDREISKLHSVYAWGVVAVILFGTVFLQIFGNERWQWLPLLLLSVPVVSAVLFAGTAIPPMEVPQQTGGALPFLKNKEFWLCFLAIFLGGSAECTMSQWSSGYLEQALGIPKIWGDVFGVALFAVMLGLGRTLYATMGRNIGRVLLLGAAGATLCYLLAALSPFPILGLLACAFTGFCVSMMWPGSLIVASDRFPAGGVVIYAMMAAGGDLGASVGPQFIGLITDYVIAQPFAADWARAWGVLPEQLGMKCGMLAGAVFPLVAVGVYACLRRSNRSPQERMSAAKTEE